MFSFLLRRCGCEFEYNTKTHAIMTTSESSSSPSSSSDMLVPLISCPDKLVDNSIPPVSSWMVAGDSELSETQSPSLETSPSSVDDDNVEDVEDGGTCSPSACIYSDTNTNTKSSIPRQRLDDYFEGYVPQKWEELSHVLPSAAREMFQSAMNASVLWTKKSCVKVRHGKQRHSDLGSVSGFSKVLANEVLREEFNFMSEGQEDLGIESFTNVFGDGRWGGDRQTVQQGPLRARNLPPFSSLPWIDRQLVYEWRTISSVDVRNSFEQKDEKVSEFGIKEAQTTTSVLSQHKNVAVALDLGLPADDDISDDEFEEALELEFEMARMRVPIPLAPPEFENLSRCHACAKEFLNSSNGRLRRHHCRLCARSFCNAHSAFTHKLPHVGYDPAIPERVCEACKVELDKRDCIERTMWRFARCRDFLNGSLIPYFEPGVDSVEDIAWRIAQGAIAAAKQIPLGAQAYVAVETVDILRKHGLKGIYGLVLRKEFMAAADLLRKVTGIEKNWPLSVHELTAAIFYALAQHKAVRGNDPERENLIHMYAVYHGTAYNDETRGAIDGSEQEPITKGKDYDVTERLVTPNAVSGCLILDGNTDAKTSISTSSTLPRTTVSDASISLSGDNKCSPEIALLKLDSVVDETDTFDPLSKSIANLLALADEAIEANNLQTFSPDQNLGCKSHTFVDEKYADKSCSKPGNKNKNDNENSRSESDRKISFKPVCKPVDDATISSLLFYAPLALYFIYAETEVDMQLLAAQQKWQLLYAHLEKGTAVADRPASALFVHQEQRVACFAVRGTATMNDVVTDIRAMPVPFPDETAAVTSSQGGSSSFEDDWTPVVEGQGLALCGMARAATHLFRENIAVLVHLAKSGYRIRVTGHSLGGGVASLLGALIMQHFEHRASLQDSLSVNAKKKTSNQAGSWFKRNDLLRVYTYGTPSCVDERLAKHMHDFVISTVLHDDIVPRLTPTSVRRLIKHLLFIRETWVKVHLNDDITAIANRASRAWAPRWRGSVVLKSSCSTSRAETNDSSTATNNYSPVNPSDVITNDTTTERGESIVDGEAFYEAEETLIESDDESEGMFCDDDFDDDVVSSTPEEKNKKSFMWDSRRLRKSVSSSSKRRHGKMKDSAVPFDEPPMPSSEKDKNGTDGGSVIVDEMPLPRMYLPGRIAHMYTHRGGYKIAFVPRSFKELRRISLAGNMLTDHMSKSYYEALLETQAIRRAKMQLPRWAGFAEDSYCSCCASRFTWASTSDSLAQEIRDKHNCRSCGKLVCGPCSENRISLPEMGLGVSQLRVCDKCYYDNMGKKPGDCMTRSFLEEN